MANSGTIPGERSEARYSNYFSVGHAPFEVILEFGQFYDDSSQPQLHTRIVMNPAYANAFRALLRESLQQYENSFGPIPEVDTHE